MTECKELKIIVREAAASADIDGVMALTALCADLSYERVAKVWHGNTAAKFCDVEYVLSVLDIKIKWSK